MSVTVAQMSREELKEIIALTVEQKLLELLGDPDEGLEIRKSVRERLLRQKKAVAAGERGEPFEDVVLDVGGKNDQQPFSTRMGRRTSAASSCPLRSSSRSRSRC